MENEINTSGWNVKEDIRANSTYNELPILLRPSEKGVKVSIECYETTHTAIIAELLTTTTVKVKRLDDQFRPFL